MLLITSMTRSKIVRDDDLRELSSKFETTGGPQITVRAFIREHSKICYLKVNIDQIVDV